jgi:hypothetical protein
MRATARSPSRTGSIHGICWEQREPDLDCRLGIDRRYVNEEGDESHHTTCEERHRFHRGSLQSGTEPLFPLSYGEKSSFSARLSGTAFQIHCIEFVSTINRGNSFLAALPYFS